MCSTHERSTVIKCHPIMKQRMD